MNKEILKSVVQDFIFKQFNSDILSVSLGKSPFPGISPKELAQQLSGRKKAASKLPTWYRSSGIYYPPNLNLEQASSEETGRYKAALMSGDRMVDLTGGFGVDAFLCHPNFREVHYCERDPDLAAIATHNFIRMGAENVHPHVGDGLKLLQDIVASTGPVDWIYLDPSRRKADRRRVFQLEDCEPPILEILPALLRASRHILMKTSPLLDLAEATQKLGHVREVHIVGVRNEVRELLWWLQEDRVEDPARVAVNLKSGQPPLRFTGKEESEAAVSMRLPATFLYEPNACILKAGAFKLTGSQYGLFKLHPSTHLYTSEHLQPFPGRRFRIRRTMPYKPGKLPYKKANVSIRNFPESVTKIRKRNRIADGGDTYLFFVRCLDEALRVLECERIG